MIVSTSVFMLPTSKSRERLHLADALALLGACAGIKVGCSVFMLPTRHLHVADGKLFFGSGDDASVGWLEGFAMPSHEVSATTWSQRLMRRSGAPT